MSSTACTNFTTIASPPSDLRCFLSSDHVQDTPTLPQENSQSSPSDTIARGATSDSASQTAQYTSTGGASQMGVTSVPEVNGRKVTLASWNMHGDLMARIRDPAFLDIITQYDIIGLQETWLLDGIETALPWPDGYKAYVSSRPRPAVEDFGRPGGGVAVLIREELEHSVCTQLQWPDLLVFDMGPFYLVVTYILPSNSNWMRWTDVAPMDRAEEVVSFCAAARGKGVVWVGDLNARTGDLSPCNEFPRRSMDGTRSRRGSDLVDFCRDAGLVIVNGTSVEAGGPGAMTSFQPNGSAVVDYAILSSWLIGSLSPKLSVHRFPDDSDHALLALDLCWPTVVVPRKHHRPKRAKARDREFTLPPPRDPLSQEEIVRKRGYHTVNSTSNLAL